MENFGVYMGSVACARPQVSFESNLVNHKPTQWVNIDCNYTINYIFKTYM